ncbi:hypothetical protein LSM04_008902 [Trypanosoma melophagium]|uniref:uncharacterized protein n=1 Tax=Trypanosoma melophagium TaxID=715481 RepID=UPI00351A5062|nr:hypothetical protein LSM04_008902 [Trypanosoma melophagium]
MLVQLRRVVYLLVLLHFCTCVINSVSGTPSRDPDLSGLKEEIDELKAKVEEEKVKLDGTLPALSTARSKYKTTAQRAKNDSNECKNFAEEIKSGLTDVTDNEKKEAEELVDRCTDAARDVKNAAAEADKKADDRIAAAEKHLVTVTELYKKCVAYSGLLRRLEEEDKVSTEEMKRGFKILDDVRAIKSSAKKMKKDATTAKREIANAQKLEEAAAEAAKLLEDAIQNPKTAARAAKRNNDQHVLKENGRDEGSKEERETSNNPTAAETLNSQNMLTDSRSTATMDITISGFSDSSSSPALVHGPLLLLVLLCVLGCTLVC